MNFDLEFDYQEALERQHREQSEVDELRSLVEKHEEIPNSLTDKQVSKLRDGKNEKKNL